MKFILLTSDDLGVSAPIDDAIFEALAQGLIASSNIMVPAPRAAQVAKVVREKGLTVGIHLTLTCEWDTVRWGPLTGNRELCGPDGSFFRSHAERHNHASDRAVVQECRAQIEQALAWGLIPSHLDVHMAHPESKAGSPERHLIELAEQVGKEFGLNCTYGASGKNGFTSQLVCAGMELADIQAWLDTRGPGIHHLVLHLAHDKAELDSLSGPENKWAREYRVRDLNLLYGPLPSILAKAGIKPVGIEAMPQVYRARQG